MILLRLQTQLCCSVLDSVGGEESYSVSVSCVGSPANVQGFDNVPAPQSQKNLWSKGYTKESASLLVLFSNTSQDLNLLSTFTLCNVQPMTDLSCLINSTSCP